MVNLLKTFGKGILYVIGLPFFILALLLFAVIGFFAFIFQVVRSIIFFFTGQTFFPELPEDKELRLLKERKENAPYESAASNVSNSVNDIIVPLSEEDMNKEDELVRDLQEETDAYQSVEEACFQEASLEENEAEEFVDSDEQEIDALESLLRNDEGEEEEHLLETKEEQVEESPIEEELEQYVPRSSNYNEADDEEDTDDSGVNIFDI